MQVTYIDHMGSDLSVVNAARVSFSKKSKGYVITDPKVGTKELSKSDTSLIQFLARGCTTGDWETLLYEIGGAADEEHEELVNRVRRMPTHWTPFGHTAITLHIKAPIFVARQLGKHQVGMVWNEVSRRYVTDEPEFYVPDVWRKAAENVKQGSSDEAVDDVFGWAFAVIGENTIQHANKRHLNSALDYYKELLDHGVCPEQARMVLPQSMYTEWYWTGNLYSFANVFIQRTDSHAQREVQEVARQIGKIIEPLFPVSWKALTQ